ATRTRLQLDRQPGAPPIGVHAGFTVREMADIVRRVLDDTGISRHLSSLVLVVGHGSISLNNPHESAHDCGACGGGRGGPNERAVEAIDTARRREAHERCRRFDAVPRWYPPLAALAHVEGRAADLAQPRPEYGHATNAFCVIGRRARTRGLFLDRRAFLVSYDPAHDEDGAILARVMTAV